jgi:uncharacterized repeat protein (TIGR01451 family)
VLRTKDFSSTALQQLQPKQDSAALRLNILRDQTRGVTADNTTHLLGVRHQFKPFENLQLIRYGDFSNSEGGRLLLGMEAAKVWEDDLAVQAIVDGVQAVIVNDVAKMQEVSGLEYDGKNPTLRVVKVASKITAQVDEIVDFTIRFDNLSRKTIGNVTIIDHLTPRLEYVPDSAECSLTADFVTDDNPGESLVLRWEIQDPIPAGKGGIIRFQCRVR